MVGHRIGPYVVRRKLGAGGMGEVYVAEHETLPSKKKVVKVLLPEWVRNAQIVQRFRNEAQAAALLQHRNIIDVDDCGQLPDGQWFILMPFLDGKSLDDFLRERQRLTAHQAIYILAQVCNGLRVAHEAHIVHRDLKPANVFLTHSPALPDGFPYAATILDFGIAKLSEGDGGGLTKTGSSFGTPAYMAPEQSEDASRADPLSDVYALGVMAYQLVTGELPFDGATAQTIYFAQKTQAPVDPRWKNNAITEEFARVILAAVSPRPVERPPSAQAFALALASATPAAPPYEPSGIEIIGLVARELLHDATPRDVTVRHPSSQQGGQGTAPMPNTAPGAPAAGQAWPPSAPQSSPHTTLGAANGQSVAPQPTTFRSRRWPLIAAGAAVVAAGAVTIVLAAGGSRDRAQAVAPAAPIAIVDAATEAAAQPLAVVDAATPQEAQRPTTTAVAFVTDPDGATVFVDGVLKGTAPMNLELPRGTSVQVRAELAGHDAASETVAVGDTAATVRLKLPEREPPASSDSKQKSRRHHKAATGAESKASPPTVRPGFNPNDVGGD